MKKIILLLGISLVFILNANAEYLRGGFNGWGTGDVFTSSDGWFVKTINYIDATGAVEYKVDLSGDWGTSWGLGTSPVANSSTGVATKGAGSNLSSTLIQNKYYTYKLNGTSDWTDRTIVLFETDNEPVSIISVEDDSVTATTDLTVTITLDADHTQDTVYVRYTNDSWSSSTFLKASKSSSLTYQAVISGLSTGEVVSYYIITSSFPQAILESDPDVYYLNRDINGGNNYSFTVPKNNYTGTVIDPSCASTDLNSIKVNKVEGYEYAITVYQGDTTSLVFQDDTLFDALNINTEYDIYQRVKETSTTKASHLSAKMTVATDIQDVWGHRYAAVQADQNPEVYVDDSVTMSVEWGVGAWVQTRIGYGETKDISTWTWKDIVWFEDGDGTNKRCKISLALGVGTYYYVYEFANDSVSGFQYGDADWSKNKAWDSALVVSYITVLDKAYYSGIVESPETTSVTDSEIKITKVEGYEYAITASGGDILALTFQDDTTFSGLSANTEYDIYQRVKETATMYASVLSTACTVTTGIVTSLPEVIYADIKIAIANNSIRLDVVSSKTQDMEIAVYALSGRLYYKTQLQLSTGGNEITLSKSFDAGIYVVKTGVDNVYQYNKVVVR